MIKDVIIHHSRECKPLPEARRQLATRGAKALDVCYEGALHSLVKALLPLRFCHRAIREMLFGAIVRPPSIPHKPLRTPALAEPAEFSLGFSADFARRFINKKRL